MKELIDAAAATGAEFEIYSRSLDLKSVSVADSEVKDIDASMSRGVSIRLIKDGRYGFSFTSSLADPAGLVNNAMASLKGGVEAGFSFPKAGKYAEGLNTFSEKAAITGTGELVQESLRIRDALAGAGAQTDVLLTLCVTECRLLNSSGLDISWKGSSVEKQASLVAPGGSRYFACEVGLRLEPMSAVRLQDALRLYEFEGSEVRPPSGKANVLFMPQAMDTLLWRLQRGASGQTLHQKVSPLTGKTGKKLFSDMLTLRNDPLDDSLPGARAADDEGVPCVDFRLIDKGVFGGFYCDLDYSARTGLPAGGHGFRRNMMGGDPLMIRPQPCLAHLRFDKGNKSFDELLREMGEGVVVFGTLGQHTGNILNGDFSIGLSLGFYVRNGRIVGKCRDTMVSGNVYDIMKRAAAVGSGSDPVYGNNPPVLFEGVDVSC